jgi:hypothetical protein
MKRLAILILFVGLVAVPLFAQLPTGTLSGNVTDGKAPLPGVTVTVTSPNLQGSRTTVTGINGDYILTFLPPGPYKARFELQGFQTQETTVKVNAAQTQRLDAIMPQTKVSEEVTVTGTYETISSNAASATTYEKSLINKLPVPQDLNNTVLLAAGVSGNGPSGNIEIAGAQSYTNLFMVNGVVVNENIRGQALPLYIEDAIQETTTSISAVSAEYGRFEGGVINTLTKSGGNEFHGSFRDTLSNQKWTATTPLTVVPRQDKILNTYEATLGGFILKDHIWFFAAGRDRKLSQSGQTYIVDTPFNSSDTEKRYEGKLTLALTSNHRLVGSYMKIDRAQNSYGFGNIYGPSGFDFFDLASIYDRTTPEDLWAANYTGVLSDNFFVEGQYSQRHFTFENSGSRYTDLERGTWIFDPYNYANYAFYNSPIFCAVCNGSAEKRDNQDAIAKASWFLSTANAGSHDIVLGVDQYEDKRLSNNWQSGSNYGLTADGEVLTNPNDPNSLLLDPNGTPYPVFIGGSFASYIGYFPIATISNGNDFKTDSVFANDKWRLNNNWSFNIGVRYDKNDGRNANGAVTAKDSKVSPRLSATWDPKGDGSWNVYASYAKYVSSIANSIGDQTANAGTPASIYYLYDGPDINTNCDPTTLANCQDSHQAIDTIFTWFNSLTQAEQNNLLVFAAIPGLSSIIPKSLNSPSADEWTIGASTKLGTRGEARLDYINRKFKDFYMQEINQTTGLSPTDQYGNQYDLAWIVNSNLDTREYNGILLSASYRVRDELTLGGNLTWSTLKGNILGETGGSGPVNSQDLSYPEYKAFPENNPEGYLSGDQRWRGRVYAIWDVLNTRHNKLSASLMESYFSGLPYDALGSIADGAYVTNPGYLSPPSTVNYYFARRGAFRTDNITRTDIGLNYSFVVPALGTDLQFFVQPYLTNVFNEHGVTNVNASVYTSINKSYLTAFNPFTDTPVECPQNADAATCTSMGANWQKGPNFGKPNAPTDYQTPRTFAISFGVRF